MIPLFKSHFSLLKSILTLEDPSKDKSLDLPDSVVDIAVENKLKSVVLVEDSMSSFLPASIAFGKQNIDLIFGYRVSFVNDSISKEGDAFESSHKNIIFPKNKAGYDILIKLSTLASVDNFYKQARLSYKDLHKYWTDDLAIAVPFYDSFIHKNLLLGSSCIPDFRDIKPTLFLESNNLPFDYLIEEGVMRYNENSGFPTVDVKSIYYKNKEDYEAYLTLKCLNRKVFGTGRTLESPNFDHMSSREFSWESFVEANKC